jgi:hypothetical protein
MYCWIDDLQIYKSKYARLTLFYDFCRGVYSVTESQLKEKKTKPEETKHKKRSYKLFVIGGL